MRGWRYALVSIASLGSMFCNAPRAATPSQSSDVLFVGDPNVTKNLAPWDHIQIGGKNLRAAEASARPDDPGTVTVVPDPLGVQGNVYQLKVTNLAGFKAGSAASDRVDLWNEAKPYIGMEGQECWEHFRMMFRSTGDAYRPTIGEWNWVAQHHNDDGYIPFQKAGVIPPERSELVWGIDTRSAAANGGQNTQLFMVIRGGDDRTDAEKRVYVGEDLRYDHWYDLLVHVVWSHNAQRGMVEWWLDGKLLFSDHIADLWQRPDGKIDHVNFEFSNYRIHADWPSSVYYSKVKLGLTRESVSF
jgi:hypothetical protein